MARKRKYPVKKPFYVGEVIRVDTDYIDTEVVNALYDVISVEKRTFVCPGGSGWGWDIVIKGQVNEQYYFYWDVDCSKFFEIIQTVDERLWNL
jgi:hypothetical protein